jgi:uncharacterized protein (UPF0548 family)
VPARRRRARPPFSQQGAGNRASPLRGQLRQLLEDCAGLDLTHREIGATEVEFPGWYHQGRYSVALGSGTGYSRCRRCMPHRLCHRQRRDFGFGTRPGHLQCGEESFPIDMDRHGCVSFRIAGFRRSVWRRHAGFTLSATPRDAALPCRRRESHCALAMRWPDASCVAGSVTPTDEDTVVWAATRAAKWRRMTTAIHANASLLRFL